MERRGQKAGSHFAASALWIDEHQPVEIFYFLRGADPAVKIFQIRAAAQRNVLAIIDMFAAWQHIRSRAAAKKRALLKETNAPARLSQRDAGCQTR
jgi:hypothetical protein